MPQSFEQERGVHIVPMLPEISTCIRAHFDVSCALHEELSVFILSHSLFPYMRIAFGTTLLNFSIMSIAYRGSWWVGRRSNFSQVEQQGRSFGSSRVDDMA